MPNGQETRVCTHLLESNKSLNKTKCTHSNGTVRKRKSKGPLIEPKIVEQFCTTSSIRGISKVYRSDSIVLRTLWLSYIVLMISLLLFSCIKIIREYLEYNTTEQIQTIIDDASPFPALTVCPHQVFSEQAIEFWKSGVIMTPKEFAINIREASKIATDNHFKEKFFNYEKRRLYYQSLGYSNVMNISHSAADLVIFCETHTNRGHFTGSFDECGLNVFEFTTPDSFTCLTMNVKPEHTMNTKSLKLIVNFPRPRIPHHLIETTFIHDIFQNALGGVIGIHEAYTLPCNLHTQIEPDRFVQISYKNIYSQQYSTPKDPCTDHLVEENKNKFKIRDLGRDYTYTYKDCMKQQKVNRILKQCNCVYGEGPRPLIPNHENNPRFCGYIPHVENISEFYDTIDCLYTATSDTDSDKCVKRCKTQSFEPHVSNTAWSPKLWQIVWLANLLEAWSIKIGSGEETDNEIKRSESLINAYYSAKTEIEIKEFLKAENYTLNSMTQQDISKHVSGHFASIQVSRSSNDTIFKEERLSLSTYGLVSRIGGSCTLYLGLTCAFLIEIVEFFYHLKHKQGYEEIQSSVTTLQNQKQQSVVLSQTLDQENDRASPILISNSANPWELKNDFISSNENLLLVNLKTENAI